MGWEAGRTIVIITDSIREMGWRRAETSRTSLLLEGWLKGMGHPVWCVLGKCYL